MELRRFWWWVVLVLVQFGINGCFGCLEQERIALLQLKASMMNYTSRDGYDFTSWDSADKESDCCDWESVTCNNTTGRVIQLYLTSMISFDGEHYWYPNASLFLPFEELQYLDLSFNYIPGWVSNEGFERFSALSKLEELDLSDNDFNNSILLSLSGIASLKNLYLSGNKLNGSIHIQEFKVFSNLEELDLSFNEIHDIVVTTEDSNRSSKLQVLDLSFNKFSARILASLAAFPSLKVLDINYNNLEGSFTTKELGTLNKLEELYLDYSSIDKSILHKVGVMTSLNVLTMRDCGFNGSFLAQDWCELRKLKVIDLSGNNFEGKVPSCIANLTSLEYLSLSDNDFLNPIRFSLFSNLSNLKVLLTDNNAIDFEPNTHRSIPTFQLKLLSLFNGSFNGLNRTTPRFLQYQYDLRVIDLSHNNLVGKFPNWLLENNTRLKRLVLNSNYFTGPLTVPYDLRSNVTFVDISDNYLQGPIPTNFGLVFPYLSRLYMSKNAFQGSIPSSFGNMESLRVLDMSENSLSETIPIHFTMARNTLDTLKLSYNHFQIFPTSCNLTHLRYLYLDNNHFSGKIPNCISLMHSASSIDLSNNYFSGMLPTWMGNMSYLSTIALAQNQLEGQIPLELCKLDDLSLLDLSGNNFFGSVPSCFNSSHIRFVHLNKNRLSGPIPSAFQNKSDLVTLDLRDNYLTGNIPDWISSLSSLSILLLRENHFRGRIPIQLCLLQNLNLLDLSNNNFLGPIPPCLSNITFAESSQKPDFQGFSIRDVYGFVGASLLAYLDTNSANIRRADYGPTHVYYSVDIIEEVEFATKGRTYSYKGDILKYMSGIDLSCNRLTVFNVSHNNLSGSTPDRKNQFETFDESSYEGNPLLCGLPLHNGCTEIGPPSTMPADHEGEESGSFMDMGVFYISFVVAYITILLGIVTVLYINPYWRREWFNFIEACIDTCYCFVVVHCRKLPGFKFA